MGSGKEESSTNHTRHRWLAVLGKRMTLSVRALGLLAIAVIACGFLVGFFGRSDDDLMLKTRQWIGVFGKVYTDVALNYVDPIDPERFMHAGIDGMLKTLDPYTVYLGEKESDELDLVTTGKYAGVGITIGLRDGYITVISPMEGFSAAKQGIQSGDRILEIDGKVLKSRSTEEVRELVRGVPGTSLKMKIEREGEPKPLEFVLIREEIPVRNVTFAGFVSDGIAYIRLERFSRTAGDDVRSSIKDLQSKGSIKGVVLDLRDNPGGLLDIAVDVVSKFLPESTLVVSTKGRRIDSERKYYSTETPMLGDVPLAVLVDRGSASASEIVAAAIQDVDRGVIVGTRSFGKGLVQTITRITENSSLKITSGRYYTPSGRSIQEVDYFHRTKDGVFTVKPDSARKKFRTAHNRVVLDGEGIVPDTTVADEPSSKLLDELARKAMLFKFANHLATEKRNLHENLEVTDALVLEFDAFLKEKDFQYEEDSEVQLKALRESAGKARYGKQFYEEVDRLAKIILEEKGRAFERYDKEVRRALKLEIIERFKGEKTAIQASFKDDRQLQVAATLLKSKGAYARLLAGEKK
ncbi:MAG: S41 family peptidase [Ignavibacteriales bacterium]|nr:S41 family peptidase [Ignavibacteriales bacterium]